MKEMVSKLLLLLNEYEIGFDGGMNERRRKYHLKKLCFDQVMLWM